MGVLEDIRSQYPTLAWLLNDPEVGALLRKAVDPFQTYSPGRFQAELMNTAWWRTRSQSQREAEILLHTDRPTYRANVGKYKQAIRQRAAQLGVGITDAELNFLATISYNNGADMEGPAIDAGLMKIRAKPGRQRWGAIRTIALGAKSMSKGQYYFNMREKDAAKWAEYIATGQRSEEDLRQWMADKAMKYFPWVQSSLKSGYTMEDIFGEHRNAIAEVLELDPEQVNLMDGRWRKVVEYFDHNSKKTRGMTVAEAQYYARQDPRFWNTRNGRATDAQGASMLLNIFGNRSI